MADSVPPDQEFHTWAEIAGYLDISTREAQYREKNEGLPVYRLQGKKSRVWAHRSELDTWRAKHSMASNPTVTDGRVPGPSERSGRRVSRRWLVARIGGAVAATAGAVVVVNRTLAKSPVRASFQGNSVCAWDETGRMLWRHAFPEPQDQAPAGGLADRDRRAIIVDFDGRGQKHVVALSAVPRSYGEADSEEVYCFSPEGRIVWRYRPNLKLTFGDTQYSGPWLVTDIKAVPANRGGNVVWLSLIHDNWRPSALLSLGSGGSASLQFVNTGYLFTFRHVVNADGRFIVAGGVNNEYAKPCFAVLRFGAPPSRSPQTAGTRFECVDGPKGEPVRYFLFPSTDMSRALNRPYSMVMNLGGSDDHLIASTVEDTSGSARALYEFSRDLEPVAVSFDEGFGLIHRRLQDQGLIKHELADCPHLTAATIADRWDPHVGWTKISVPPDGNVKPGSLR